VARINPVKVKQDAEKLEKAGKLDQAIALYRQIVDDNARDWNTINKIGDLYAKLNRTREAGEEYAKVADFYAKDGFLLKAIALWKKINRLDPTVLDPYLNLADLYAKQGLMMEAKSQYQIVVDEYIKRGRAREAGDVLKKMAEIDPSDLKIRSKLADLYMRDGNQTKAVDEHVAIAEELTKKGHLNEALQVLEKGLKIDPKSTRLRGEVARIHLVQRNFEKAVQYLEEVVRQSPNDTQMLFRLGEAYLGSKKIEEAEAVFKKLLEIDPEDSESRVQMGRVYLMQGDFDRAYEEFVPVIDKLLERKEGDKGAALLQQITQKNGSHVKSLSKLVEIYRLLRKDALVTQTYSQLTEAYINQGEFDQAAGILEILVSMEPQNAQHRTKLEFVRGRKTRAASEPRPQAPAPSGPAPVVELEEEFEIPSAGEATAFLGFEEETPQPPPRPAPSRAASAPAAPPVVPARPVIEISGPLSDEDREFIDEHLAEGRVFRKYGLVDKAADQFEAIVARSPDHVEARQELRDVYKEKGLLVKAAEQCLALAEIHRLKGDEASAAAFEEEARGFAPEAVAAPAPKAPAARPPRPPEAPAPGRPEPRPTPVEAGPEAEADVDIAVPMDLEESGIESPDLGETGEDLGSIGLEVEDAGGELPERFVEDQEVVEEETAFATAEEEAPVEEPPPPPPPKAPPPVRAKPAPAPPAPATARIPTDVQKVLDEVDSYISLGFVEDAKAALREVRGRHPGNSAIAAKVADLGLDLEEEAPPAEEGAGAEEPAVPDALGELAAPPPAAAVDEAASLVGEEPEPGGIDLGAELGELFGTQSAVGEPSIEAASTDLGDAGLADIFKEFKKGVDKQLGKEDYDTRYNLGIAYKEMGLVDEAIAEFQLAAKDENRILECSSMLGICFMEKGMPKLAVKWFEKGLKAPGRAPEEYQGLRYDLAMAHEASGDADTALSIFTELYGQDAGFRDVAAKVRDLKAALG
jgi:tetratricopeptide (TPR) repeat protein